ncbi:MAG TPA: hypothetical protein VN892_05030 [Solirubrobacteraceae bacterium]|nr:hypothetical protein [Solirubrobacteraceae bacterium]
MRTLTDRQASLGLQLKVYMTRGKLDRQIADGTPDEANSALALRTRQLTAPDTRREIAGSLRNIMDYADRRGSQPIISAVVIEPRAVRGGRRAILELAERLEATMPVSARGVALARALLTDSRSPLFNPHCERTVSEVAWEVKDALDECPDSDFDVIVARGLSAVEAGQATDYAGVRQIQVCPMRPSQNRYVDTAIRYVAVTRQEQ